MVDLAKTQKMTKKYKKSEEIEEKTVKNLSLEDITYDEEELSLFYHKYPFEPDFFIFLFKNIKEQKKELKKLRLRIIDCNLGDKLYEHLNELNKLSISFLNLNLSRNNLKDTSTQYIKKILSIKTLKCLKLNFSKCFEKNQLNSTFFKELNFSKLDELEELSLNLSFNSGEIDCEYIDLDYERIKSLKLNFSSNKIYNLEKLVQKLGKIKKLKLIFFDCKFENKKFFKIFCEEMLKLNNLSSVHCDFRNNYKQPKKNENEEENGYSFKEIQYFENLKLLWLQHFKMNRKLFELSY